jgi:excisionase family DNA binding protein
MNSDLPETPVFPDRLLTPEEAAKYLKVSPSTLAMWRSTQRYKLPYYKVGSSLVRYKLKDLIALAQTKTEETQLSQ